LKYRVPPRVTEMILKDHPDRKMNILDLGCGTGLLALYLGRIDGFFVGVDLSQKMLDAAEKLGVYSRLHMVDIHEALEATDTNEYEIITALDVLVYVGDPVRMIAGAYKVLRPGGKLYLSCEAAHDDEPAFIRRPTQRFAHRKDAIVATCDAQGFANVRTQDIDLRMESGAPLPGFLLTASKPR
jgi:predicted TPR repeat methyltransferase